MANESNEKPKPLSGVSFVSGGPKIPFDLLRAHQDDGLVIFCDAGISQQFDLPDFKTMLLLD